MIPFPSLPMFVLSKIFPHEEQTLQERDPKGSKKMSTKKENHLTQLYIIHIKKYVGHAIPFLNIAQSKARKHPLTDGSRGIP